mmetsp:Transcript_30024/g.63209  ORF Transcript_30024/g.63209 Transcript_30024/m.63209 type:complete len:114 (+) Transcript_30024:169-510(+)
MNPKRRHCVNISTSHRVCFDVDDGNPIIDFVHQKIIMQQKYASHNRSMFSNGHSVHVATMENHDTKFGASNANNESGASAIRIPFSCTWKLAKKNARADDVFPQRRNRMSFSE